MAKLFFLYLFKSRLFNNFKLGGETLRNSQTSLFFYIWQW